jgi:enoyl-CoA hydratase/carnithine racemase
VKNRFNPAFNEAMLKTYQEIEDDAEAYAVILTSSDQKSWIAGQLISPG